MNLPREVQGANSNIRDVKLERELLNAICLNLRYRAVADDTVDVINWAVR